MSLKKIINESDIFWMHAEEGSESDIVISSRVRLARNLRLMPFPPLLNTELGRECINNIKVALENSKAIINMEIVTFDRVPLLDRQILVEKHLTSPNHALNGDEYRGIIINSDGSSCIMLNEEDHLRIQTILPGLQVDDCYARAQQIDDELEKSLNFAFDIRKGYLTSCPTNMGTGMRASVMIHLPAIAMTNQTGRVFSNLGQMGMTVRGLYGEGTEFIGNLYQLSNQITIGQTESDINSNLSAITRQIIEQERYLREKLRAEMPYHLEDTVGRAFGILTNARVITSNEALVLLSNLRLGVDMGIINNINAATINELMVAIRPAHLQKYMGMEMDSLHRDIKRAEVIKNKLLKG